jgi:hypothetical protein
MCFRGLCEVECAFVLPGALCFTSNLNRKLDCGLSRLCGERDVERQDDLENRAMGMTGNGIFGNRWAMRVSSKLARLGSNIVGRRAV